MISNPSFGDHETISATKIVRNFSAAGWYENQSPIRIGSSASWIGKSTLWPIHIQWMPDCVGNKHKYTFNQPTVSIVGLDKTALHFQSKNRQLSFRRRCHQDEWASSRWMFPQWSGWNCQPWQSWPPTDEVMRRSLWTVVDPRVDNWSHGFQRSAT